MAICFLIFNVYNRNVRYRISGHFPFIRTGWLDNGWTSQFENEIGFFQECLLTTHLLRAYYLGFDWSGWKRFDSKWNPHFVIMTGRVWPVSSDNWKVPSDLSIVYMCRGRVPYPGGRGGTKKRFLRGGSAPRPTLYTFKYHLWQNKYAFSIPSIDEWYPFHMPSLELCIPSNCFEHTVFKIWINQWNQNVFAPLWFSHTIHLSVEKPFWAFYRPKWQTSLHILQQVKSLRFRLPNKCSRFFLLLAAMDGFQGGTSAPQRQEFHTHPPKSMFT